MALTTDATSRALEIRLFGPPSIHIHGDHMPRLRSRKGLWLLSLLALRAGREVDRSWLAGTLWPESLEYQALASMRRTLTDLRDALGPEGNRIISVGSKSLTLDLEGVACDVVLFDRLIASDDEASLMTAVTLYRGSLLEGCLEEWVAPERRAREEQCVGALERLAELAAGRGAPTEAVAWLQALLRLDPFRETACRSIMHQLDGAGQSAAALQAYREFREQIWAAMNSAPSPETTALYESIRAGELRKAAAGHAPAQETSSSTSAPVRIHLFGELELVVDGRSNNRFETRKTALLLARLALGLGRTFSREELADLLWPGDEIELSRERLRKALGAIRQQFGARAEEVLESDRVSIRLNPAVVDTDLRRWESAVKLLGSEEEVSARVERLLAAAEMRSEPLLPSFVESWIVAARQQADESFVATLVEAAQMALAAGEHGLAYRAAQRALTVDPLREEAVAAMVDALAALGRHSEAAQIHADYARKLDRELGMRPGAALEGKAAALRSSGESEPVAPAAAAPAMQQRKGQVYGLPPGVTTFFGREEELAHLEAIVGLAGPSQKARLVTLLGTGGSGKTRLATEFARRMAEAHAIPVAFVPLADLDYVDRVMDVILDVLKLRPDRRDPIEQMVEVFAEGPTIFVLDNFEHLLDAAPRVTEMLAAMPRVICIVTSRVLLELHGEHAFPVLPLATPKRPGTPEELQDYPSVRLFVDRAVAARRDFVLDAVNAPAVVALCEFLEGIPLALELAAGRAAVLTPEEMLGQIEDRFDFLISRRRDVPERHRTLRAAIDWSYENLPEACQRFFRSLSIFRGGWTLEAAREVCGDKSALQMLEELRARSLVIPETVGGVTRYRMLDTIREVGNEALTPEERQEVAGRHAAYYSAQAVESYRAFASARNAEEITRSVAQMDMAQENARAALDELIRGGKQHEVALALARALDGHSFVRGHLPEGRQILIHFLEMPNMPPSIRAHALCSLGWREGSEGRIVEADRFIREALELAEQIGDVQLQGHVALQASTVFIDVEDHEASIGTLDRAVELRPEWKESVSHLTLRGIAYHAQGALDKALACHMRSVEIARTDSGRLEMGWCLGNTSEVLFSMGRYEEARIHIREAIEFMRNNYNMPGIADCTRLLAQLEVRLDKGRDTDRAVATVFAAEGVHRQLCGFAMRRWEKAARDECIAEVRRRLGEAEFAACQEAGRELSLDQSVDLILSIS